MSVVSAHRPPTQRLAGLIASSLVATAGVVAFSGGSPAVAETLAPPVGGAWSVIGHGHGHGHGLSQYGARGQARRGRTSAQIVAFYYPGTTLGSVAGSVIRVKVTDDGTDTVVGASPGLILSGAGGSKAVKTTGISKWRLKPYGKGFAVDYLPLGKTVWKRSLTTPSTTAIFSRAAKTIRLYRSDKSSTVYRGTVGAVRTGNALFTLNRVLLDDYVKGVLPREMPSAWEAVALQAQAIAARSYSRYAVEHHAASSYDICDTTLCQVYGGMTRYSSAGALVSSEAARANAAITATAGKVVRYKSATIFAQFSASNGGWSTAGGQPYLVAKADPYAVYSGDPYLSWARQVPLSRVATAFGLTSVQSIQITQRDGHGQWGGRVLKAIVTGRSGATKKSVATSGVTLALAMGLPHSWFGGTGSPFGHVESVKTGPKTITAVGWAIDPNTSAPIRVQMYIDSKASAVTVAGRRRPDIAVAYPGSGPNHGFALTMRTTAGRHRVCLFAINTGPGTSRQLSCHAVTVR